MIPVIPQENAERSTEDSTHGSGFLLIDFSETRKHVCPRCVDIAHDTALTRKNVGKRLSLANQTSA